MDVEEPRLVLGDLRASVTKVREHGIRADGIINSMLLHARESAQESELASVEELLLNSQNLSFHGMRAKQQLQRVLSARHRGQRPRFRWSLPTSRASSRNILSNALYATGTQVGTRSAGPHSDHQDFRTQRRWICRNSHRRQRRRNSGIAAAADFPSFFTTKPPGEGTGLSLSISYVTTSHRAIKGELRVESREGEGADFVVRLPLPHRAARAN